MPRIAELRPDLTTGDVWVRLEKGFLEEDGPISIYTEREIEHLRHGVALAIADKALELYPKPSR